MYRYLPSVRIVNFPWKFDFSVFILIPARIFFNNVKNFVWNKTSDCQITFVKLYLQLYLQIIATTIKAYMPFTQEKEIGVNGVLTAAVR